MSPVTGTSVVRTSAAGVVLGAVVGLVAGFGAVSCDGTTQKSCITYARSTPSGPTVYSKCGPTGTKGGRTSDDRLSAHGRP